jgi:hypothetical protein
MINKLLLIIICWLLSANLLLSQSKRDKIDYKELCFCPTFCLGDSVQKLEKNFILHKVDTIAEDEIVGNTEITIYSIEENTFFEESPRHFGYITSFSTSNQMFGIDAYNLRIGSYVDSVYLQSIFPISYKQMTKNQNFNGNGTLWIDIINNPFYLDQVFIISFLNMQITSMSIFTYN